MNLEAARRAFAEELRIVGHVSDERVIEAFATVSRGLFVGPGPWRVLQIGAGSGYSTAILAQLVGPSGQVVGFAGRAALKSLRRDLHDKEDTCWLHGNGWCLSKRGPA